MVLAPRFIDLKTKKKLTNICLYLSILGIRSIIYGYKVSSLHHIKPETRNSIFFHSNSMYEYEMCTAHSSLNKINFFPISE